MFKPAYTFEMMLRTRRFWGSAAKALRREEDLSFALGRPCFSTDEKPAVTVSIDRTGLYNPEPHSHDLDPRKEPETALAKQLKALIRFRGGPITMAEYMSEALTNATAGYYMRKDVFGQAGDFVTSPEISQLFGEMVGVWCMLQWEKLGEPKGFRIVELGPGRGTLMADMLRGVAPLKGFCKSAVTVHMVEVSEAMRKIQRKTLNCNPPREWSTKHKDKTLSAVSGIGNTKIEWHRSLAEIPEDLPTMYIAHEFFDALPAHQFVKTERGWCERLVDIAGPDSAQHLRLVLSPGATPATSLLLKKRLETISSEQRDQLKHIEVSAASISAVETIARRISRHRGAALIVDYGKDGPFDASMQAIRDHKFVNLLSRPGEADLSCRVDFAALRQGVEQSGADAVVHGPIPQAYFLAGLGIETRLDSLLCNRTEEQQDTLIRGYNRIVGGDPNSSPNDAQPSATVNTESIGGKEGVERSPVEDPSSSRPGERVVSGLAQLSEKLNRPHEEEGMGYSYKVMAITNVGQPPPVPFPGSGVEFEDAESLGDTIL